MNVKSILVESLWLHVPMFLDHTDATVNQVSYIVYPYPHAYPPPYPLKGYFDILFAYK
jgi:hypothetical protein